MPPKKQSTKRGGSIFGPSKEVVQRKRSKIEDFLAGFAVLIFTITKNSTTSYDSLKLFRLLSKSASISITQENYNLLPLTSILIDINKYIEENGIKPTTEQVGDIVNKYITQTGQLRKNQQPL